MASDNEQNIRYIKGVGEKRAKLLKKLGIDSLNALLRFYPRSYLDLLNITPIFNAPLEESACFRAVISTPITEVRYAHRKMTVYRFNIKDSSGEAEVTLYNTEYLAKTLKRGETYLFYGKITGDLLTRELHSPIIKGLDDGGLIPIYPLTAGITSAQISRIIRTALESSTLIDPLPASIKEKYDLCSLTDAIREIHFPSSAQALKKANHRLVFEELFLMQASFGLLKQKRSNQNGIVINNDCTDEFFALLPFSATSAQRRVTAECIADMKSGRPLNRLVQGDVGSGKTAVAAALCHTVIKNGYQATLMAPTEILAEQHFATFKRFFEGQNIICEYLTGSHTKKQKADILTRLENGEIDMLIGTHALISDGVTFKNLALTVTDEQHRFGVAQRSNLTAKGTAVHSLVMSATPIPRTLSFIIYGELDISIIDEYPKNRQTVKSYLVDNSYRNRIYAFLKKHFDEGRQGYIVCPMVEENENFNAVSAEELYEELSSGEFSAYRVGLLHGKMKPKDKDEVMTLFKDGQLDLLISTTVIEVGIDVPNATVMVIENAERFGLSQLHQLRGRIGRGKDQSYCIFISSQKHNARLNVMCNTTDGFKIADEDLKLRGPGDFIGQRQHGLPLFKIADLSRDMEVFRLTAKAATELLTADPTLKSAENLSLKAEILNTLKDTQIN